MHIRASVCGGKLGRVYVPERRSRPGRVGVCVCLHARALSDLGSRLLASDFPANLCPGTTDLLEREGVAPGAPQSDSAGRFCIGRGLMVHGSSSGRSWDRESGAVGTPGGTAGAGRVEPFSCLVAPAGGRAVCVLSPSLTMGATG